MFFGAPRFRLAALFVAHQVVTVLERPTRTGTVFSACTAAYSEQLQRASVDPKHIDRRKTDRRRGGDRRGKSRASRGRRKSDRRGATPPAPALFNVSLVSAGSMSADALAGRLVEAEVARSADAAHTLISKCPVTLSHYMPQLQAYLLCAWLRNHGAEAVVTIAHVTCPHCGFSVACEGHIAAHVGVQFTCPACEGQVLLDARDHMFHPVLRCGACSAVLILPFPSRPGGYRCKCGSVLRYDPATDAENAVKTS